MANYYIDCNGQNILVNVEDATGPRLTGEWGGDQCAGCGIDIIETGLVSKSLTTVHCTNCGTRYEVRVECSHCGGRVPAGFVTCGASDCQEAEYHANAERAKPRRRKAVR